MNLIAAVDRNWSIGNHNQLLAKIPADMKFFRESTMGKVVVMGRKTLESFPNARPLYGRKNIVLTRNREYFVQGAVFVHTTDELFRELEQYDGSDIYVIGGESVYRQLLEACDTAYITKIEEVFEADAFFPNLDGHPDWKRTVCESEQTYLGLKYFFCRYERTMKRERVNDSHRQGIY